MDGVQATEKFEHIISWELPDTLNKKKLGQERKEIEKAEERLIYYRCFNDSSSNKTTKQGWQQAPC